MHESRNASALRRLNGNGHGRNKPPTARSDGAVKTSDDDPSLLLTIDEVARLLTVSVRSVCRMHSAGWMPKAIELLGCTRWRRRDIETWVAARCPKLENGEWLAP